MKKILLAVIALLMCFMLILSGCAKTISGSNIIGGHHKADDDYNDDEIYYADDETTTKTAESPSVTATDSATDSQTQVQTEVPTTVSTTEAVTETTTEKPTEAPTTEPTTQKPSKETKSLGQSSKGYSIEMKNGVVYVGGIIIANKTYALPEDYYPGDLTAECDAAYMKMKSAAASDGISLWIVSGFRSYATQASLYNRYSASDGQAAADTYSARPGHSEHQTGLAMDINSLESAFANTPEGKWLAANAWKYGFILRYPSGKESVTGYIYEPWHYRYVGEELAKSVYESGLCLEEYFGITSVYA